MADHSQALETFAKGYDALVASLEGVAKEDLTFQRAPEKWSIQEIVIHVADTELGVASRVKQIVSEERPVIQPSDQDLWATHLHYQLQDLSLALEQFRAVRAATIPLLEHLPAQAWERVGVHPTRGSMTVLQLVDLYGTHVMKHVAQIEEIKDILALRHSH